MAFAHPLSVLNALRRQYLERPETLTEQEQGLAERVHCCCRCQHIWCGRSGRIPRRCPNCNSTAWNMPTVDMLNEVARVGPLNPLQDAQFVQAQNALAAGRSAPSTKQLPPAPDAPGVPEQHTDPQGK